MKLLLLFVSLVALFRDGVACDASDCSSCEKQNKCIALVDSSGNQACEWAKHNASDDKKTCAPAPSIVVVVNTAPPTPAPVDGQSQSGVVSATPAPVDTTADTSGAADAVETTDTPMPTSAPTSEDEDDDTARVLSSIAISIVIAVIVLAIARDCCDKDTNVDETDERSSYLTSDDMVLPPAHYHHDFIGMFHTWRRISYFVGASLLTLGVLTVMNGIFTRVNNPPWDHDNSSGFLEFLLFWIMLFWIAMLEGCQISIVGLQAYDIEKFRYSHPRAYRNCKMVLSGPNVERFLVGRQFLLLFNGFMVSRLGGGSGDVTNYDLFGWEWGDEFTQFFFSNGVLLMIVIVALGQLPTQLVAADKMLGFFDLPLGHYYLVVWPCLIVESIGLTHSSYLLKDFLCWISGIDQSKADKRKAMNKNFLYWARCLLSVTAVIFSATFVIKGLAKSQTNATEGAGWRKLPGGAAVVVSLFFIFMLACAEGLQVSVIALATVPASEYKHRAPLAYRVAHLALKGRNMSAFLVGRQFLTAMNMVLLARVTSYAGSDGELLEGGDWGMGKGFNYALLQTGFLGAILVVNVAQLASQVTASLFPISVINNYFMYWMLVLMLFVEAVGIVNACWPLAFLLDKAFDMKPDAKALMLSTEEVLTIAGAAGTTTDLELTQQGANDRNKQEVS